MNIATFALAVLCVLFFIFILFLCVSVNNLTKKNEKDVADYNHLARKYNALLESYNDAKRRYKRNVDYYRMRYYMSEQQAPSLDDVLIRKLRMLCHPDKHGGSKLATEVTQQLNRMVN